MIVVGGIDWRFADPLADTLVGLNFSGLAASTLARSLIAQLGASQGLTEVDLQKIMNGKVNDVALGAGDILVIPDSSGKRATTRAIEAAIQAGTMIATYGIIR